MASNNPILHIVGAGLAGSEAAWQAANQGISTVIHEMRPTKKSAAHHTGLFSELVCSNSFKSQQTASAPGLLKREMRSLNSLIIEAASTSAVPAGKALAVDRNVFASFITEKLKSHPCIECRVGTEICELPKPEPGEHWIIATGPLTSQALANSLSKLAGAPLAFYDAIAPIIATESIDMSQIFMGSRYNQGSDYLNIPLDKSQYDDFIERIQAAEKTPLHAFEATRYFEACLPIEVMIDRGAETLRFGPMKPVGLTDPKTGKRPHAVLQLRRENAAGTYYSMVGFQTKMKWPAQKEVFRSLPGLQEAEFYRFGSVHRNTYVNGPQVLNADLSMQSAAHISLAGQITGVEGYTESAAIGLLAGRLASAKLQNRVFTPPPAGTMMGALLNYVTKGSLGEFQPMNANLGLLPPIEKLRRESKLDRKSRQAERSMTLFKSYLGEQFNEMRP